MGKAGDVGLSLATLLAQNNRVVTVDTIPEKGDMINRKISSMHSILKKYMLEKS